MTLLCRSGGLDGRPPSEAIIKRGHETQISYPKAGDILTFDGTIGVSITTPLKPPGSNPFSIIGQA